MEKTGLPPIPTLRYKMLVMCPVVFVQWLASLSLRFEGQYKFSVYFYYYYQQTSTGPCFVCQKRLPVTWWVSVSMHFPSQLSRQPRDRPHDGRLTPFFTIQLLPLNTMIARWPQSLQMYVKDQPFFHLTQWQQQMCIPLFWVCLYFGIQYKCHVTIIIQGILAGAFLIFHF